MITPIFMLRYPDGSKLAHLTLTGKNLETLFEAMIDFLDSSGALTVAFAQGGDYIGGLAGGAYEKRLMRKAMNTFFCRTDRPIEFRGTMNEDVTAIYHAGEPGGLVLHCRGCLHRSVADTISERRHERGVF